MYSDMRFTIQVDISSVQVLVLLDSLYFVIFSDCQYHIGLHGNLRTGFRGAPILQFRACPLASLVKCFFPASPRDCSQDTFTAIEDAIPECVIQRNNSIVLQDRRKPTTASIVLIIITSTEYNSLSDGSTSPTITYNNCRADHR